MAKKQKSKGPDEETKAAKAAVNDAPLRHKGLEALKQQRDALVAEEEAKVKAKREAEQKENERRAAIGLKAQKLTERAKEKLPGGAAVSLGKHYDVWRPDLDKELYSVAMSGVVPLVPKDGAPRVRPNSGAIPPSPPGKSAAKHRRTAAQGGEKLVVQWSEGNHSCAGARPGKGFALEALGRFAKAEDTLDLHGLDTAAARARVDEFVRTRRARGVRVVCIVHGVGKHSEDGTSVLRDVTVTALSEPPGCLEVDAFKSAEPPTGRTRSGSLWVALRGSK